jgi:hypothetical protein
MADFIFVVSRTEPKQYMHLKHAYSNESEHVVLDRRSGERRRSQRLRLPERRHKERRRRNIDQDLQSSGWALVRRD